MTSNIDTAIGIYKLKPDNSEFHTIQDGSPLLDGIKQYQNSHQKRVEQYKRKHKLLNVDNINDEPTYFRKLFFEKINALDILDIQGDEEFKDPIKMEAFFGKKLMELYKLALEEEINSKEYRIALVDKATEKRPGEKWAERPILIIAGPSACGKTTAAKNAIKEVNQFLIKDDGNFSGNEVITIDGGLAREVSQIRNWANEAAKKKGYKGIKDLEKKSKILKSLKDKIYKYAMLKPDAGIVIPKTFSFYFIPLHASRKMFSDYSKLKNVKPVFVRIDGQDSSLFQKVVEYMGSSRAWNTKIKTGEGKAYEAGGFKWGMLGSKLAEREFRKKFDHSMVIYNDLTIKRSSGQLNEWVDAKPDDTGVVLVSKRVFEKWEEEKKPLPLEEYAKKEVPPLIRTANEIKLEIIKENIRKKTAGMRSMQQITVRESKILNHLDEIGQKLNDLDYRDKRKVRELGSEVSRILTSMKVDGSANIFHGRSGTYTIMKDVLDALKIQSKELYLHDRINKLIRIISKMETYGDKENKPLLDELFKYIISADILDHKTLHDLRERIPEPAGDSTEEKGLALSLKAAINDLIDSTPSSEFGLFNHHVPTHLTNEKKSSIDDAHSDKPHKS